MSLSRSNLFLFILFLGLLFRWQFFGGYLLFEENITFLEPVQDYLVSICKQIMPEPQSSLLSGILIGQKQDLTKEFKDALTNTSTIHIVVVSGQNLSMLAGFLLSFSSYFGRKKTVIVTIGAVIFYALLTGLQLPVIRAAFMSIFTLVGTLFNREVSPIKMLLFTLLLMLLANPTWLESVSFQLSFLATVGVMVVAPEVSKWDHATPAFIKQDLWVSISAQLLTIPIIAINFHRVSVIGLFSNLLVLWTVAPVMIMGIFALIGGMIWTPLGVVIGLFPNILLLYFVEAIQLTDQSWSSVYLPSFPDQFWLGYYLMLIGFFMFLKAKNNITYSKYNDSPRVFTT